MFVKGHPHNFKKMLDLIENTYLSSAIVSVILALVFSVVLIVRQVKGKKTDKKEAPIPQDVDFENHHEHI